MKNIPLAHFGESVTSGSIFIQYDFVHVSHVLKSSLFSSVHVELFEFSIEKLVDFCLMQLIWSLSSVLFAAAI